MKRTREFMLGANRKKFRLRTEQYILLGFMGVILLGAILLTLPFASRSGESAGFLTALFTSTSATCVTGLVLVDTYLQWSGFGQVVIICLIQIGGLGFMTAVSVVFFLFNRKIGLNQRLIMAQAFSLNDIDGIVQMVKNVIRGTIIIEGLGAVILSIRFAFVTDIWRAIRWGVFHSVSAFCNAGFDILGFLEPDSSLTGFATDPVINFTVMGLIILGGLGFYVWMDLKRNRKFSRLSVYSKMVLTVSGILIVAGTVFFAIFEWNNPETIGNMNTWEKIMASMFQSVTCRTAGFAGVPQGALTDASKAASNVLMLIGGSSGSTAGGIKTVTFGVLLMAILGFARGRSRLTLYKKTIAMDQIRQAMTIAALMIGMCYIGAILLCYIDGFRFLDSLFETASALGTVGLSTGITPLLSVGSRIMIIIFMFFGRVGILTFSVGFLMRNQAEERFHYAETKMLIG